MTIRIVILTACVSTLVLTSTLARAGEPIIIDGVVISSGKKAPGIQRQKAGAGTANRSSIRVDTGNMGNARRGPKVSDRNSPIPDDRRIITGAGAGGGPHRR